MSDDLVPYITNALGAVAALGTAAYGLVDATKAFGGGASNAGFRFIRDEVQPFIQGHQGRQRIPRHSVRSRSCSLLERTG